MDQHLIDVHFSMDQNKVLLYYKGPFDDPILSHISEYLRGRFNGPAKAGRKLFAVFIELAQNIAFYSAETNYLGSGKDGEDDGRGVGTVVVHDKGNRLTFTAGNMVDNATVQSLVEKCQHINSLSYEELKALKKEVRRNPRRDGHNGGNIGLIQVALKSETPLEVRVHPVNDQFSFFLISTDILI